MPDSKRVSADDYEGILRQVRDIISARVVMDEENVIQEIHVLAGNRRSPKQIVRDIESAFMAQFNLPIDHKKVSVAQVDWESGLPGAGTLAKVAGVELQVSGLRACCSVSLEIEGETCTAVAEGAATQHNRVRLAALATLGAVELYLKGEVALALEGLRVIRFEHREVAVVVAEAMTPAREERLVGASFVCGDTLSGVAQAALRAVERCLPLPQQKR